MKHLSLVLVLLLKLTISNCQRLDLEVLRDWKQLDFAFPSAAARSEAITKKLFVAANAFPIDVEPDYQGKVKLSYLTREIVYCQC